MRTPTFKFLVRSKAMNSLVRYLFIFFSSTCYLNAADVPEPITRLVSRPTEIGTGIFQFRVKTGILTDAGEWIDELSVKEFSIAVDGSDWVQRYHEFRNIGLTRGEFTATYYEAGMGTPAANQRLTLEAHQGSLESDAEKVIWKMCRLIGAVPRQSISKHISQNPPTDQSRTEINGVRCQVFEYSIKRDEFFDVLTAVHHTMLDTEGVTLRLSLAEDFGFALVRSEVLGPLGSYDVTTSQDFVEVADNVFLPRNWKRVAGPFEGVDRNAVDEIDLIDFKFVNEPLPEGTFDFEVPAGTSVTDQRPGGPMRRFNLDNAVALSQLDRLNDAVKKNVVVATGEIGKSRLKAAAQHHPGKMWILMVVNAIVFAVLVTVFVLRSAKGSR